MIINISALLFTVGKQQIREKMLGSIASKYHIPLVYINQIGGNDDLIFDGICSGNDSIACQVQACRYPDIHQGTGFLCIISRENADKISFIIMKRMPGPV